MTGPAGNSEFCFPETLHISRDEAEGSIEVQGKQNSLFLAGAVIKCLLLKEAGHFGLSPFHTRSFRSTSKSFRSNLKSLRLNF